MTKATLKKVIIKKFLPAYNKAEVAINDGTILNTILSSSDGYGTATSSNLFKGVVIWTIMENTDAKKVKFPKDWMDLSVQEFTDKVMDSVK